MQDLKPLIVSPDATLLEGLRAIDRGGQEIAFVCEHDDIVIGTLTDGDVRRALLGGAALDDRAIRPATNTNFVSVGPEAGRVEVIDLMRACGIRQIPVLDSDGRLIGLHLLQEMIGATPRPNSALILAGGRGSRLGPLTQTVPKPMVPVAGRPILERLVLHLVGYGIRDIYVSVNHLRQVIEDHFGDGSRFGCRIRYLREEKPLGTGGPLSLIEGRPEHPLLVMNGDLVTQANFERMLAFHERGGYAATFGLRPHSVHIPYGVATLEGDRLLEVREKPTERWLVNAGIYVLSPEVLELVPRDTLFPITDLFELCIARGMHVGGHLIDDEWIDVGEPAELRRARGQG